MCLGKAMTKLSPENLAELDQQFAQARQLHMSGQQQQASEIYQRILAADPEHADALHLTGVLCLQRRQYSGAIELIEQAIAIRPSQANYRSNLGNALRDSGQFQAALKSYGEALAIDPGFIDAEQNMGKAYLDGGEPQTARACFERALAINPDFAPSLGGLATVLQQLDEPDRALEAYRRAVELDPGRAEYRTNMAAILVQQGAAQEALEQCDRCLAAGQQTMRALAIKSIALAELGRGDEGRALMDLNGLLQTAMVETPGPYDSTAAFNRDLAEHITAHPSLMRAPPDHATRFGWHTGELANDDHPAIHALKAILTHGVERRLATAPPDTNHPFWAAKPSRFKLNIWSVIMESQGHQISHIHPSAWMGGVYYPELPPEIAAPGGQQAGWIEFGRGYDNFYNHSEPVTRAIKPVEGLLVTFPSYFWHRTIPFQSEQRRISVAFDAVPA
jgi:Tfp pilus assembly protein PilF